jgi:tRNA-splicing ligase RtcB
MRVNVVAGTEKDEPVEGLRVFDDPDAPAAPSLLEGLRDEVHDADLAAAPVVLPDFHHKDDMEMPSSIVVATRDTIRPTFTSASVNCGMALLVLDTEPPNRAAIEGFFRLVRERYPHPPRYRTELSAADVLQCTEEGARFAVDHFGLDPADLERIEMGGRIDTGPYGGPSRLRRELPWLSVQLSRLRFGSIGPTNHFVELQRVEEILDPWAADRLGVHLGQTTLQYHAGGGVLTGQVGRLFGSRRKDSKPMRVQMAVHRPVYQLGGARSRSELRRRLALYFSDDAVPVSIHEPEGTRLMLANAAAMNYGFAFRAATYGSLRALAKRSFGVTGVRLAVDSPHNSIYEEEVDGDPAIVHRHNSCRAYPASLMPVGTTFGEVGQALLLPGTHRTSSYLCVAASGASRSLHSACHGAGTIIEDLERSGRSLPHPGGHSTLEFGYGSGAPIEVPHLDDRGVDTALNVLVRNGLVRPVARMRPQAVLH